MIKQFANNITFFLIQENIIQEDDAEVYLYGTEQILINLITFVMIGLMATIIDVWIETVFFFVGMVPIRIVAGGYHAKTPQKCNILSVLVYVLNVFLINLLTCFMTYPFIIIICTMVLVIIFHYAPVDHKNRVLNDLESIKVSKHSKIIGIVLIVFCTSMSLLFGPRNLISLSTMMGALTASISLFIGSIVRGGERFEGTKFSA